MTSNLDQTEGSMPESGPSVHDHNMLPLSPDQFQHMPGGANECMEGFKGSEEWALFDLDEDTLTDGESVSDEGPLEEPTTPRDLTSPIFTQLPSMEALRSLPPYLWYGMEDVLEEEGLFIVMPWENM